MRRAEALSAHPLPGVRAYPELPTVSDGYPRAHGSFPTRSSPVRHVSAPKDAPSDLHALGTPPALILSQDQTLHQVRIVSPHPPVATGCQDAASVVRCLVSLEPPVGPAATRSPPPPPDVASAHARRALGASVRPGTAPPDRRSAPSSARDPRSRAFACHLSTCWVPNMEPPRRERGDHSQRPAGLAGSAFLVLSSPALAVILSNALVSERRAGSLVGFPPAVKGDSALSHGFVSPDQSYPALRALQRV